MSLFAGLIFAPNPQHVIETSRKLFKAIADFRPDPLRVWKSDNAVLAATADSDLAALPLTVHECGNRDIAILAASRLDRVSELASKLSTAHDQTLGGSRITEVLFASAYLRWGSAVSNIWTAISPLGF